MSTVKELHIALDVQCQKLNSNAYGNLLPEQKDWLLNESVIRFIKQRINPRSNSKKQGFASTIKRYDDLEALITPYTMSLYKYDDDNLFGIMPYNYLHHLSSKTKVAYDCNNLTNTTLVSINERYCIAELKDATSGLYGNYKIELNNGSGYTTILDGNNATYLASGIPTIEAKFIIINWTLEQLNLLGAGAYFVKWERYDNIYAKNSFIFVTTNTNSSSLKITTDTTDIFSFVNRSLNKYNYTITNTSNSVNRIIDTKQFDELIGHSFGSSKPHSPICKFESNRLIINHNKKFISNSLEMNYIRFPRKIDINLNQGSELDPSTDDEIIAMTVQKIKAILDSKNYNQIINENLLTE